MFVAVETCVAVSVLQTADLSIVTEIVAVVTPSDTAVVIVVVVLPRVVGEEADREDVCIGPPLCPPCWPGLSPPVRSSSVQLSCVV